MRCSPRPYSQDYCGSTDFAAEVHAIKKAISDALWNGLRDLDIFSDLRSAFQVLYSFVPFHSLVAEIRELV